MGKVTVQYHSSRWGRRVYTWRYMLPYIHLNLYFWHLSVPTFGLMLWLACVAAAFVMDRNFKRAGITADAVGMVAVAALLGIVGAKLAGAVGYGGVCVVRRADFGDFGAGVSRLVGEDRRAADAGLGGSGGGDRVRHRADRVLSFRRWLLRDPDETALGHELSEWD